jgi:hypothetical protein
MVKRKWIVLFLLFILSYYVCPDPEWNLHPPPQICTLALRGAVDVTVASGEKKSEIGETVGVDSI